MSKHFILTLNVNLEIYQEGSTHLNLHDSILNARNRLKTFNFVTLDSSLPSNHGVLDPIVVLDKEQAVEVAKNMLEFLLQAVDDVTMDQKTATITEAINAIVEKRVAGEKVGFKHVLKVLRSSTSSEIASRLVVI